MYFIDYTHNSTLSDIALEIHRIDFVGHALFRACSLELYIQLLYKRCTVI